MARRTFTWNAYESTLTGALSPGITSVVVDSTIGLAAPVYLVIDPDVPAKREWVRVNTINGSTLENLVRNQAGSVGDVLHETGAKIRAIFAQQHLDDIFLDIEENTAAQGTHADDAGNPHANAGYLKQGVADNTYLALAGGTMAGAIAMADNPITGLPLVPVAATEAVSKDYIDNLPAGFSGLHADLTDLPLPDAHHTRYADTEAITAMGIVGDANPYNHTKYVDPGGVYLPLAGGTMLGLVTLSGVPTADLHAATKKYVDDAIAALPAPIDAYTKTEVNDIVASYYTLSSDPRAVSGRKIYISAGDPGAMANGEIWHDIP